MTRRNIYHGSSSRSLWAGPIVFSFGQPKKANEVSVLLKAGGGKRVQSICFESLTFLREGACNPSEGRLFLVSDILPVPLISGSGLLLGLRATKLFGAFLKLAQPLLPFRTP